MPRSVIVTAHAAAARGGVETVAPVPQCVLAGMTPADLEPFLPQRFFPKET